MKLPDCMTSRLATWAWRKAGVRDPDVRINGNGPDGKYLWRWWLWVASGRLAPPHVPRCWWGQGYLHWFGGPDDDRALHDHPWWNITIVLHGHYREVYRDRVVVRSRGDVVFRRARTAHRIDLVNVAGCWTLFITGRKSRDWGFHTHRGFIPWQEFEQGK